MDSEKVQMVGFPDFWQTGHHENPAAFKAVAELRQLENALFAKPISEPLHKVMRHLAKVSANSLRALTTLLLNGYGHDGMKIARGIFEASVTVAYLRKHPNELEDYFDFESVLTKRRLDYHDRRYPELVKGLPPERRKEIEDNYVAVVGRFTRNKEYGTPGVRALSLPWPGMSVWRIITTLPTLPRPVSSTVTSAASQLKPPGGRMMSMSLRL